MTTEVLRDGFLPPASEPIDTGLYMGIRNPILHRIEEVEVQFAQPIQQILRERYMEQRCSVTSICQETGLGRRTIGRLLLGLGFSIRPQTAYGKPLDEKSIARTDQMVVELRHTAIADETPKKTEEQLVVEQAAKSGLLDNIAPRQRAIILMHVIQGMSFREIQHELGIRHHQSLHESFCRGMSRLRNPANCCQDLSLLRLGLPPEEKDLPVTEIYRRGLISKMTLIRYTSSLQVFLAEAGIHLEANKFSRLYEAFADSPVIIKLAQSKKDGSRFEYRVDTTSAQTEEFLVQIKDRLDSIQGKKQKVGRARLEKIAPYLNMLGPKYAWVLRQRLEGLSYRAIAQKDEYKRSVDDLRQLGSIGMRKLERYLQGKSG